MSQTITDDSRGLCAPQEELKRLMREERPRVVQAIAEARGHGDLSENASTMPPRNARVSSRGASPKSTTRSPGPTSSTRLKSSPTRWYSGHGDVFDTESGSEVTYRIVGEHEADIKEGRLSINSPVAKALIGHRVDEEVTIKVPSGLRVYEIIDIRYA